MSGSGPKPVHFVDGFITQSPTVQCIGVVVS